MPINKGAVVWCAMYRFCNIAQQEMEGMLGGVDYSAVSQARKRLQEIIKNEKEWGDKFNEMQSKLSQMSRIKICPPLQVKYCKDLK